jgi:RNA polymerase sigma-70 factor (sigma-E family)
LVVLELRAGHVSDSVQREQEFQHFAARAMPKLLKGGYLLTRDADLAEDLVQGTLLRVFRNWDRAREAPDAYSQQALISVARDYWRRRRRRPREIALESTIPSETVEFSDEFVERDAIEQALTSLSQQQREVLVLRYHFDLSVADTAQLLKIAEGTVKSTTSRGLQELRALLGTQEGGEL